MNSVISWKLLAATAVFGLIFTPAALAEGRVSTKVFSTCDGGAQEAVITDIQDAPASSAATTPVQVGTVVPGFASGAAGDSDVYTVLFAGESAATSGGFWTAQAQMNINGAGFVNMNPNGPNTFHRGNGSRTTSMTWCNRVVATSSANFRIVWQKFGGGTANIDDFIIQVHRSN